jgi:hypothetical protein
MRLKNWQIEALQKENNRLNLKLDMQERKQKNELKMQKEKHEQELIDVEIKARLLMKKEQILENLKHG